MLPSKKLPTEKGIGVACITIQVGPDGINDNNNDGNVVTIIIIVMTSAADDLELSSESQSHTIHQATRVVV
jgi:hypothetical protein